MSTITIQSINYSGEVANILFKPNGVNVVINLGNQVLPYVLWTNRPIKIQLKIQNAEIF